MAHFITSANARQLSALGHAAKAKLLALAREMPPDAISSQYQLRRLARARKQLDMIDARLEQELGRSDLDAQLIDRLAAASMRLSDQEFALANRPKPAQARVQPQAQRRPARPAPTPSKPAPSVPGPTTGSVQTQAVQPETPQSAQG